MNDTFLVTGVGCNYFSKLFWVLYRVREKKKRTNKWARNSRNYLCSKSERERVVRARERGQHTRTHSNQPRRFE